VAELVGKQAGGRVGLRRRDTCTAGLVWSPRGRRIISPKSEDSEEDETKSLGVLGTNME